MIEPLPHVKKLSPYQLPDISTNGSLEVIQLAQNENFLNASTAVQTAAREACWSNALYPEADAFTLRQTIAKIHQLKTDQVICGRGSMELISLLATAYLDHKTSAVISQYGYLYFATAINATGAKTLVAAEPELTIDPAAIVASVRADTKLIFIANPGNPTGSYLPTRQLMRLREQLPESVLLVIDEAYAEYLDRDKSEQVFTLAEQGNTVILRTFSKIYGLAGLRIGWGYFPPHIAATIRAIQQPNGVTAPSQAAAKAAMEDRDHLRETRDNTREIRNRFTQSLISIGLNPCPAYGNFVLVRFMDSQDAANAAAHLRRDSIIVRPMNNYGLDAYLRITIGTVEQMRRVTDSLGNWKSQL